MRIRIWRPILARAGEGSRTVPWMLVGAALLMAACGGTSSEDPNALHGVITMDPALGIISKDGTVTFTGSVTNGTEPYQFDWNFDTRGGRGVSPSALAATNPAGPVTYANRGKFTVALTITDANGLDGTATATVRVPVPVEGVVGALKWATDAGDVTNLWGSSRNWH